MYMSAARFLLSGVYYILIWIEKYWIQPNASFFDTQAQVPYMRSR